MSDQFIKNEFANFREQEIAKARHVVTTGRGLSEYEERLMINRDMLAGKYILDLGSGVAKFPEELCEYFSNKRLKPHLICLDIAYDFQNHGAGKALLDKKIYALRERFPKEISFVAGLFSSLPFSERTFDYVFSLYAFPLHIREEKFFEKGLHEIIRVLKIGGTARLAPLEYNSGIIGENGAEKYLTYFYNPEHFESIFIKMEKFYHGQVKLKTFRTKNVSGLTIEKF